MHQLRALVWKAYKVRSRSPLSTALDLFGPVTIIIIYLSIKALIGSFPSQVGDANNVPLFRNPRSPAMNPRDLPRYLCPKMLFYSNSGGAASELSQALQARCAIELINTSGKDDLIGKLEASLRARIAYKATTKTDLNRSNSTSSCSLPGIEGFNYQVGVIYNGPNEMEVFLTDSAGHSVIYQPYSQGSTYNEFRFPQSDLNSGFNMLEICIDEAVRGNKSSSSEDIKWQFKSFPITVAPSVISALFMVFLLSGFFCNTICTVMRVAEDNESGFRHYVRASGVSAAVYWSAQYLITFVHMLVQSLLLAVVLAIPTNDNLLDPTSEANITIRFLLFLTYSLSINAHATFIGSLFYRVSLALLATCFLAICYAMYAITFFLQWNPYRFSPFGQLIFFLMMNPVSNFQALLLVLTGVYLQTGEPLKWSHLHMGIVGGGMNNLSLGSLWLLLLAQAIVWLLLTIVADHIWYSPTNNPVYLAMNIANDLFCCNTILPSDESIPGSVHSKSSTAKTPGSKDPNRLCCSLRDVSVAGRSVSMAHTKGDVLKLTDEQLRNLHLQDRKQAARSPKSPSKSPVTREEPILLDDAMQQNIVWRDTRMEFHNLGVDFRFNQVSFVLGQTNLKELFFETLMGLHPLISGHLVIDGVNYTSRTLHHARSSIGYLGEKDIFLNEMSIHENLQFFGGLRDPAYTSFESESNFLLSLLHLTGKKAMFPATLTARSARKLSLAVAAVGHTKLLLLVEPTLSLRWRPRCQVLNLLKKYKSIRSIIVDTSDVDEAVAVGDKVLLLKDGQIILNGPPSKLLRKLSCGYWIVFEPVPGSNHNEAGLQNLAALEKLVTQVFKQDKLERLDLTTRSVYEQLMSTGSDESGTATTTSAVGVARRSSKSPAAAVKQPHKLANNDKIHKATVIGKIKHSEHTNQAICSILNMFAQHSLHGFRLAELTYESLEDILVFRMARATYPDLPPDLLLALQHRIQADVESPQVSARRDLSESQVPKAGKPIFRANVTAIMRDRFRARRELLFVVLSLCLSLLIVGFSLWALQKSLELDNPMTSPVVRLADAVKSFHQNYIDYRQVDQLYSSRMGLYIIEGGKANGTNSSSSQAYLNLWPGNKNLVGTISRDINVSDAEFVNTLVQKSKDSVASIVFYDPQSREATLVFEPHFPHNMMISIKHFMAYRNLISRGKQKSESINSSSSDWVSDDQVSQVARLLETKTSKRTFQQPWHEIVQGLTNRRMFYGMGFAIAEGIAIGVLIIAPLRHRVEFLQTYQSYYSFYITLLSTLLYILSYWHVLLMYHMEQSRVLDVSNTYWFAMAIIDLTLSMVLALGYTLLIVIFDGMHSLSLILCILMILFLYKLASLPLAYLVSLLSESIFYGMLFITFLFLTIAWAFSVNLKSWIEWTIFNVGYLYTITSWLIHAMPISSLIGGLTDISQINRMNDLCGQVPAYIATTNLASLEGPQSDTIVDKIFDKLRDCLESGKNGISLNVLNQDEFGIVWDIGLIILFGVIGWIFLLSSERLFGFLARRFSSHRTSSDLMKKVIRSTEPSNSAFKWNREKDRLVSEYVRCVNEVKYVKHLAKNCVYLRIWLRPMSDQSPLGKNMMLILDPLFSLGLGKNEIRVELKTTLQIFIRIGSEASRSKIGKAQLIESYAKFLKQHNNMIAKFAVVDWTREMLYKILLHGHYNTKSTHNFPNIVQ